jgi:hypothetical protein
MFGSATLTRCASAAMAARVLSIVEPGLRRATP